MTDRSVSISLEARVSGFVAGIATAGRAVSGFTAELEKSAKKRQAVTEIGSAFGKLGLAAGAGFALAVASAANFDQAMSKVQAATHDSSKQMGLLRVAAINAGRDTVFSATEAASAIEEMAKAGVSTKDILAGGLTGALNLASAGTIEVGQAAEIAATTMNQFGLAGNQVSHVADVLSATAGKAQGGVMDMAEALKYVGPVASQMGVSLEQTAGTIGFLAKQGILGSQAGTSLRGMLTALTSPSKAAAKEMDKLHISMYDAKGDFVGLDGIAGQLHKTMSGLSNAERDHALGVMFGNQQITAARILYAGGAKAVDGWTKKVNDSGYAAQTAALKMNNLKGDLEQLKGSLETALIGTGEGAQGPLRSIVQDLTGVVNAYSKLPAPAKSATGSILGFTAAAGGSIWAVTSLMSGIGKMRENLSTLGGSFSAANKGMLATRGAAAAAGLGLMALGGAIDDTHHTLGTLSKASGAAMMGWSVGGPWGAAIGGGISLLASFAGANANAAGEVAALTATLDQQTGAITGNTREWVIHKLTQDGVLQNAQSMGLDLGSVTKAAMGNANAMAILNRVLEARKKALAGQGPEAYQQVQALQRLIGTLHDQAATIRGVVASRRLEVKASREAMTAQQQLNTVYGLTPKQARTVIQQIGMGKSQSDIRSLLRQYGLTPKQVQTAIQLLNVSAAEAALNRLTRARTAHIYVTTTGGGAARPQGGAQTGYASGGFTGPGAKYDVAGVVHRREFVSDAETTARARPLLEALHQSKGRMFGFADGGAADRRQTVWSARSSGGAGGPMRIEGRVTIPGVGDGWLEGTMRNVARQEIDDSASFDRSMTGRRS